MELVGWKLQLDEILIVNINSVNRSSSYRLFFIACVVSLCGLITESCKFLEGV
jgi:hypothetical protein